MTETRYHELLGRLLDDSLSEPDAAALRDELERNPDRLCDVREHLMLSEFLSQERAPHRSAEAFWDGIRARLGAGAPPTDAAVRSSDHRTFALRAALIAAGLLGAIALGSQWSEAPLREITPATGPGELKRVSLHAEVVCEHCILHESDACRPAVRVHEAGRDGTIHLSDNAVSRDFLHREGCGRTPLPVLAEGTVRTENGRPLLMATRLEILH